MELSNTIYATNKAIDELIEQLNSKECIEKEIHYYLGNALSWTSLTLEKLCKKGVKFDSDDNEKINALKGANNALKHLENLVRLNSTDYAFRFDEARWPLKFEQYVHWIAIDKIKGIKNEYQKDAYKRYCEGKLIKNTFKEIQTIIKEKYKELESLD